MHQLRNAMFISAVLFTLGALSFRFDSTGAQWMWAQAPVVGVALGAFGLYFWLAFAYRFRRADASAR